MQIDLSNPVIKGLSKFNSPFGLEYSVKINQAAVIHNRFLCSIHKNSLGITPVRSIEKFLSQLGFPLQKFDEISKHINAANIFHIGYQNFNNSDLYKCYFEYTDLYNQASEKTVSDSVLVHYAVKWQPQNQCVRTSYYHATPGQTIESIQKTIEENYSNLWPDSVVDKVIMSLLESNKCNDDPMLLIVTEEHNDRMSFDLNLYDWGLTISDVSTLIIDVCQYMNIDTLDIDSLFDGHKQESLGHISFGKDVDGREFITLYYGVNEISPLT